MNKYQLRAQRIKEKKGANFFKLAGKKGGNKILIAEGRGERITIRHKNGKTETIIYGCHSLALKCRDSQDTLCLLTHVDS